MTACDQLAGKATAGDGTQRNLVADSTKYGLPLVRSPFCRRAGATHVLVQVANVLSHESAPQTKHLTTLADNNALSRIFDWEDRERGVGFLGRRQQPTPPSVKESRERCELPHRVRVGARTAQRFSTIFSMALKMLSPDTTILSIVDYHAATGGGGKTPAPLRTPVLLGLIDQLYSRSGTQIQ